MSDEVFACSRCLMLSSRPRIGFDDDGVCNACRYAEMKFGGGIGASL